eukprot:353414-Chlamydomonas_euryale.AAC.2
MTATPSSVSSSAGDDTVAVLTAGGDVATVEVLVALNEADGDGSEEQGREEGDLRPWQLLAGGSGRARLVGMDAASAQPLLLTAGEDRMVTAGTPQGVKEGGEREGVPAHRPLKASLPTCAVAECGAECGAESGAVDSCVVTRASVWLQSLMQWQTLAQQRRQGRGCWQVPSQKGGASAGASWAGGFVSKRGGAGGCLFPVVLV